MSSRPWMPLDIGDYLEDTGHLTTVQHGAYMLLIMEYWKRGGLPDDDRKLAAFARMTPDQWAEHRDTLADFFMPGWKHKRIEEELARAAEIIEKRRGAANARHERSKSNAHAEQMQSTSNADGPYTGALPSTTDLSSSLRSDERAPAKPTPRQQLETVLDEDHAQAVIEHRQRLRKPLTERAAKLLAADLAKFPDPNAAADTMVKRGWLGIDPDWASAQPRGSPQRQETPLDVGTRLLAEMRSANGQSGTSDRRDQQALVALPGGKRAGIG